MPTPSSRTPVKIARGSYSDLNGSISDLQEGEIVYAQDQDACYVKEGSSLVKVKGDVADAQITTAKIADDAVTADKLANSINTEIAANTAKSTNATHTGEVTGATALTIADNIVDEANLKVDNSPTDDYVLTAKSSASGGLTWAAASGGGGGGGSTTLSSDAQGNTIGGTDAGSSFSGTDAEKNTLFGYKAGDAITTSDENTFYGYNAGLVNTDRRNTFIGFEAGVSCVKNSNDWGKNTFLGYKAGSSLTTGAFNTCCGEESGSNLTTGRSNLIYGDSPGPTTGRENLIIGNGCTIELTNDENTILGSQAYCSNTEGSIVIGYGARHGIGGGPGGNNCITLGYTNITHLSVPGINFELKDNGGAPSTGQVLTADSNGYGYWADAGSSLSDERDKTQIEELPVGLDFINQLKPVSFKWKPRQKGLSCTNKKDAGFIAQDLQKAQKDNDADYLGLVYDNNPDRLEASYGKLVPVLVKAIQELKMEIETLKNNG
tara:strand:+ start:441 stop:1913 length:1473 start_codon:yes stop_codon:yes gene_type:complete